MSSTASLEWEKNGVGGEDSFWSSHLILREINIRSKDGREGVLYGRQEDVKVRTYLPAWVPSALPEAQAGHLVFLV